MRRVAFLVALFSVLALALACGEREEFKGSGSKSLVDPSAEGGVIVSSSSSGGADGATDSTADTDVSDGNADVFVIDSGADVKEGG